MGQSKKDLKKQAQKNDAANGVTAADKDPKLAKKLAVLSNVTKCTICLTEFKVTAKMADAKCHAESKHPKNKYEECFPAGSSE